MSDLILLERPNPFDTKVIRSSVSLVTGQPLALYLRERTTPVVTFLDGKLISPEQRLEVIPQEGQQLVLAQDLGDGGGGGGKMILRSLAMLAVVALSIAAVYFLGPLGAGIGSLTEGWAMAIGAAISVGGSMLVNALLPPSSPSNKQSQNYGWGGAEMTAQEGLPIPVQGGTLRRSPNVIDSYLSTTLTQQWLNILLDFGWGPADSLSQIEINGNPLSNYPGVWTSVRLGHNEQAPLLNFADIVNSYAQDQRIRSGDSGFTVVGVGTATQAAEFEFSFPLGLWAGPNGDGSYDPWTVHLQVSYRKVGDLDWTNILRPRTTAGLPLNAQSQAPYWLAVTTQWSPNATNTAYVLDVSYGAKDHKSGQRYRVIRSVPYYDGNGNPLGTHNITVTGSWHINPFGPGAAYTTNAGVNYVTVADYSNVAHTSTWNKNVLCRDVVRIDNLDPGRYEYLVQKVGSSQHPGDPITTSKEDDARRGEQTWFTALREITYDTLSYPNKVLLAVRALATDKLSGSALNITAVVAMDPTSAMGYKNEVAYDLPEAFYRMSDSTGTCADLTGHGHDGGYMGAPVHGQPGLIVGSPNTATKFATGDWVSMNVPIALPAAAGPVLGTAGWALEFWLTPAVLAGWVFNNADGSVYVAIAPSGQINFHFGGFDHLSNAAIAVGSVHHVTLGATPGGFLFLVDGVAQFLNMATPAWSPNKFGGIAGVLDEVAIYTYAIQPGRLKQHYLTGTQGIHSALEDRSPDNPAMQIIDRLVNPLYGGQQSPQLIDVPAFIECADFNDELVSDGLGGQIYRHIFNGVHDKTESLWAAVGKIGTMSRTVVMRSGTSYTCVCDKPATRSQLFTMGNIKKDSFKQSWPALLDRANVVSGTYADETNNYKQTALRVMDEVSIAAGDPLNDAGAVNLFGITNPRAAWRELMYRLDASRAALSSVQIDCALEGLAARIGDVVGVQHDVPQWGAGGRTLGAVSATQVRLDQKVTILAGVQYVLMLVMPTVQRATGVVQSMAGNVAVVSTAWDATTTVKRLVVGAVDTEVVGSSAAGGLAYLTLASSPALAPGAACELYDVDVIESQAVTTPPGVTDTVTVGTPFTVVPADYSLYFFGQLSDVQDYRISAVGRRSNQEMSLQLTKYDPTMYGDLEPMLPTAAVGADQISVTNLQSSEVFSVTPQFPLITLTWRPGKMTAGARIYLTRSGLPEYLVADVKEAFAQLAVFSGYTYVLRVVGYDAGGYAAPYASAPTMLVIPFGIRGLPYNVSGFYASACAAASVTLSWAANPPADNIDHYEIRYGGTVVNPSWDFSTPLVPNPSGVTTSATFASGPGYYLIIGVNGAGVSSGLPTICSAVIGGATVGTGGGGLGAGNPSRGPRGPNRN